MQMHETCRGLVQTSKIRWMHLEMKTVVQSRRFSFLAFVGVQSYLQISCHVSLYLPSKCCSFTKPYLQYRKIIQRFSSSKVSACFYVCLDRNMMCQIKGKPFVSLWEVKELDVSVLIVYIVEREGGKKHLKHCLIKSLCYFRIWLFYNVKNLFLNPNSTLHCSDSHEAVILYLAPFWSWTHATESDHNLNVSPTWIH